MKIIEKEAKSEEEAINLILEELGTDDRSVVNSLEVLEKNKSNFLGFNNKKILVKAIVFDEREKNLIDFVKEFLVKMNLKINDIKLLEGEVNEIKLNLNLDNASFFIGKRGKTLEAFQYLTNLIFNKKVIDRIKVIIDINDYRAKRIKSLEKLAKNLALKVRKTRKEKILEPMNPYERKIIHSTLQDDRDVETESIGDGIYKQIKIKLKK